MLEAHRESKMQATISTMVNMNWRAKILHNTVRCEVGFWGSHGQNPGWERSLPFLSFSIDKFLTASSQRALGHQFTNTVSSVSEKWSNPCGISSRTNGFEFSLNQPLPNWRFGILASKSTRISFRNLHNLISFRIYVFKATFPNLSFWIQLRKFGTTTMTQIWWFKIRLMIRLRLDVVVPH